MDKTILTHAASFAGNPASLPDPETNAAKFDRSGYLLQCADKGEGIEISDLTLTGPGVHGAIFAQGNRGLHLHDLRIADFQYAGARTYSLREARIRDCTFVDAEQRWKKGAAASPAAASSASGRRTRKSGTTASCAPRPDAKSTTTASRAARKSACASTTTPLR